MKITRPKIIFNMLEGYKPITNLLGMGDPNVHYIDGQWRMFLGGFQWNFKNNIFSASLPKGQHLDEDMQWQLDTDPQNLKKAAPLVPQPPKDSWDYYGLHEPNYVEGKNADGSRCQRIYYTGRGSNKVQGENTNFAIGFLEKTADGWQRHAAPIITGDERNPSVLGPKVIYDEGKWKIWYRATPYETIKGKYPKVEIYYSESKNGTDGWSKPITLFTREDEIAHVYVTKTSDSYVMLTSASPNLYHESPFPEQRLRFFSAKHASGNRADWYEDDPKLLAAGGADWYAGGFFGSSICEADAPEEQGSYYAFFAAVHARINWFAYAFKRLLHFKLPPFPAPFHFVIGYFRVDK